MKPRNGSLHDPRGEKAIKSFISITQEGIQDEDAVEKTIIIDDGDGGGRNEVR